MRNVQRLPGSDGWETAWEKLESRGNVGLQYCINPTLYPTIADALSTIKQAVIVDYGAGTNNLGYELLFARTNQVPALGKIANLTIVRKNTKRFIGLEQSGTLVKHAKSRVPKLLIQKWSIEKPPLFTQDSVDLAVSRNFIMHLSIPDLIQHLKEVARTLKPKSSYIFSILNPDYEVKRSKEQGGGVLQNGKKYMFTQGSMASTSFIHYFKTLKTLEDTFSKHFHIAHRFDCRPITTSFQKSHTRYYWSNCPMAYVYKLIKHD